MDLSAKTPYKRSPAVSQQMLDIGHFKGSLSQSFKVTGICGLVHDPCHKAFQVIHAVQSIAQLGEPYHVRCKFLNSVQPVDDSRRLYEGLLDV